MLLVLIIYYLISLTNALREANQDLKMQLRRERTEERRKMFKMSMNRVAGSNPQRTLSNRWKKVLENSNSPNLPPGANQTELDEEKMQARKELLARIMRKAVRKGSATSEDDSNMLPVDDNTDNEQHESLPHDQEKKKEKTKRKKQKSSKIESTGNPAPGNAWSSLIKNIDSKDKSPKSSDQQRHTGSHSQNKTASKPNKVSEASVNFKIINEKHLNKIDSEPEVFKFDEVMKTLQEEQQQKKEISLATAEPIEDDYVSDDASSYREIQFTYPDPKPKDERKFNLKLPNADEIQKKDTKSQTLPKESAPKGMRKLNSFLALVREAVLNQKSETENQDNDESNENETQSKTVPESGAKVWDTVTDLRRNQKKPNPADRSTKRQDSSSSIWSENIPVIKISKTESEENILEEKKANGKNSNENSKDKRKDGSSGK